MIKLGKRTFGNFWKRYLDKLSKVIAFIISVIIIVFAVAICVLAIAGWFIHWWLGLIGVVLAIFLAPLFMMLAD